MADRQENPMQCSACGAQVAAGARFCASCGGLQAVGRPQVAGAARTALAVGEPISDGSYGGFWLRVAAWLIDCIVLNTGFALVAAVLATAMGIAAAARPGNIAAQLMFSMVWLCIFIGGSWLYSALMESSSWQATLGKRALGLRVTDEHGERMSFAHATGRYFSKLLSAMTLGIGYLMVAFTDRKRGLHDMIANTLVVQSR
jgi:uncharacterized RDD family membrane protein YckC